MTDWSRLQHAYGDASDIPALLAQLRPSPHGEVWSELWGRLCHQGTVYSASFAVLPHLLELGRKWPPKDRMEPLALASGIVSSPTAEPTQLADLQASIAALRQVAADTLAARQFERDEFIYLLQTVLAFDGERLWGQELDGLAQGEFTGYCTACETDLYVVVGEHGFFISADEWSNEPETARSPIVPLSIEGLPDRGRWMHEQAVSAGHPIIAEWVRYLFGSASCPGCGTALFIPDAIRAATP